MRKKGIFNVGAVLIAAVVITGLFGCSSELSSGGRREVSAIVGTWELTTVSPRGTRTNTLTINEDLTGTYKGRNSETPIMDLKVEGDQVTFKMERSFRDEKTMVEFQGKLDGTTLKGQLITPRGSREVTGKKVDIAP
jgi:hypothetical protein